ncbi:hypothetical protein LSH36_1328g00000 [Paralvinella palmiformis]|uniref:Uncharacterized protein n=1 Tax=Paralvinella palmiformis TaxID=53620 RepID=A0AAD9ITX5_9ANNE|nr:hypothetical protein LSH36_1328g00000 [Paralvinella palmiformis]
MASEEYRASGIKVYMSSITTSRDIRTNQQRMIGVLEAKKVPFEKVDIAKDHIGRALLKRLCKNSNTQPPVITKGEQYLGDFETFMNAVDDEVLETFLGL